MSGSSRKKKKGGPSTAKRSNRKANDSSLKKKNKVIINNSKSLESSFNECFESLIKTLEEFTMHSKVVGDCFGGGTTSGEYVSDERFGRYLGKVERVETRKSMMPKDFSTLEEETGIKLQKLENCLYKLKSIKLKHLEIILDKLVNHVHNEDDFNPSSLNDLNGFLEKFELCESICNSLSSDMQGDVLQTYLVILKTYLDIL